MKPSLNLRSSISQVLFLFLCLFLIVSTANATSCKSIRGSLEETIVPPPDCTSPVGLCTAGNIWGHVKGQFRFTASAIINSGDTSITNVVFVTGNTVLSNISMGNKRGTITTKSAAAFRTSGDGELNDLQIITGGTGSFAGVSGSLQIFGNFVNGSGISSVEGTICLP